jgi:PKD repeat protein
MTGTIHYYFTIYDTSMNMITTGKEEIEITDDEEPVASIQGPDSAFQFEQVTFSAMGSMDNVGIISYVWEINGEEFTGMEVNYTFDTVGVYTIGLKVSDGVNPTVSMSHEISIRDAEDPEIMIEVPKELGNHETLRANATYPHTMDNVGILTYTWRLVLPDTTRISASGEIFEYDLTGILGTVTLYLTVADAEGNSAEAMYSIGVVDNLAPTVVVPDDMSVFVGTFVQFEDEKSTDNVGIYRWVWHLTSDGIDDTLDSNIDSYSYYFQKVGTYNITLTLYDSNNNSASDWFHVEVMDRGTNLDTDGDGMPDEWEDMMGLDKELDDAYRDEDRDLLINLKEYQLRTNPKSGDTDGDGMPDQWEYKYAYDEGYTDLTDDGIPQWMAMFTADGDLDGDGDTNLEEYLEGGRDPTVKDAEEEAEDNTVLYVVIVVVLIVLGIIIIVAAVILFGKVKPVEEEFPESQYPHLYRKEEAP